MMDWKRFALWTVIITAAAIIAIPLTGALKSFGVPINS